MVQGSGEAARVRMPAERRRLRMAARIVSVRHQRRVPIFVQGALGSCAGHAAVGMLGTDPFHVPGRELGAEDAVAVYGAATALDDIEGAYPPDDTGTRGVAVMEVLRRRGWISGYARTRTLERALRALVLAPGVTGFAWRAGCDAPDASGRVRYTGAASGGHQVVVVGLDAERELVWLANSFGRAWGAHGYFCMSWRDYETALQDGGEALFATP
ncbi:MAG: hypothetical protein IT373_27405 [Polyangiaceae bacterium]|nr:hypothetical protein [Polyangiaceae bacterium]